MDVFERPYEYKPRWSQVLFLGSFCALLAVSEIAHASPKTSPVSYWIVLIVSIGGVALSAVGAVDRLFFRRRIVFTPTFVLLPKPWSFTEEAIPYRAITGLAVGPFGDLTVTSGSGSRRISKEMLSSQTAFEEVCGLLNARVRAAGREGMSVLRCSQFP